MPERDMDETINSEMGFEETVTVLLNAGKVEESEEGDGETAT